MDKMILMIKGHEIWLKRKKTAGNNVEFGLYYGHNMKVDGKPASKNILSTVYSPEKSRIIPALKSMKDSHAFKFKAPKPGFYIAFVDMSPAIYSNLKKGGFVDGPKSMYQDVVYSGAWHQMAKTIISLGKDGAYKPETVHGILDIVPKDIDISVGKDLELTIYYEGKPISGVEVKAVSAKEGKEVGVSVTDTDGIVKFPIKKDGEWMFLARHRDPAKGIPDQYDEAVFVTTLAMEISK